MPAAIRETSYELSESHEASANNELSDSHGRVMKWVIRMRPLKKVSVQIAMAELEKWVNRMRPLQKHRFHIAMAELEKWVNRMRALKKRSFQLAMAKLENE